MISLISNQDKRTYWKTARFMLPFRDNLTEELPAILCSYPIRMQSSADASCFLVGDPAQVDQSRL